MASLKEQLATSDKRQAVVDDAHKVLDQEVDDKSGLTGIAIKGAYKVVQGVKPGFVRQVIDALLDDFLVALDPVYQEAAEKKRPAGAYLIEQKSRVADALLAVTDAKAAKTDNRVIKGAYDKLRSLAKKQVESAAPRLSALIDKHAAPTG